MNTTDSPDLHVRARSLIASVRRVATILPLLLCSSVALSQVTAISKVVARGDVSVPEREAILSVNDLGVGTVVARHIHPGDEIGYVAEGEVQLLIEGQAPHIIRAGEGYIVPGGVVHSAVIVGTTSARLIATHVVAKGKPLRVAVP